MNINLKIFTLFAGVSLCAAGGVCAENEVSPKTAIPQQSENQHIDGQDIYQNSPFNSLIQKQDGKTHYIHVLDIGDLALLARVHLIRNAQKSIHIQTFIWTNDESGRYVVYELLKAAKRGVKVKIIVDRWKSNNVTHLVAFIATAHPNIKVRTYNPAAGKINPSVLRFIPEAVLKFRKVNQRMHNKILLVDDQFVITGGRNYENDYYDRGVTRNFKDRDVLVIGPVVKEISESFDQYWDYELTIPSEDLIDVGKLIRNDGFEKLDSKRSFRLGGLFHDK